MTSTLEILKDHREFSEQLYADKLNNLEGIYNFLERHKIHNCKYK